MSSTQGNSHGTIIQIGDILVSEEVVTEFFACDYPVCKGICCVIGDSGAPLEEAELDDLEREYPVYSRLMRPEGRAQVEKDGFFFIDREGDIVTTIVDGSGECAYTYFQEDGSCLCSMERCYFEGTCSFRKPRSCWLYPIRVTKLSNGGQALNLHRWHLCKDAFAKGKREGIRVHEFLREPLTILYGEEFYNALEAAAKIINGGKD